MNKLYLVTGATGHVGTVLVDKLLERQENVRAFVHSSDTVQLPNGVEGYRGDIRDQESLLPFFRCNGYDDVTLIHCAAYITVATKYNPAVWETNVHGTKNMMELALSHGIHRVVYVSSVHAIPERPFPEIISEVDAFSPDLVQGQYAKSKAAAAQLVLDCAKRGLNVSIVHPSGVIGPGDTRLNNHMIRTLRAMNAGKISVAIPGGYDFVDARDVAKGILLCEEKGRSGECYILNGHYCSIKELLNSIRKIAGKRQVNTELPYGFVKAVAPFAEKVSLLFHKSAPLLTPYSVDTLHANGFFSHEKAYQEFGYSPRDMEESIRTSL